jgi:hypothetical protein
MFAIPWRRPRRLTRRWDHVAMDRAEEAHGHGHGGHAGMSMEAMARDVRNRFLVALVFTIPIVLWSVVGSELLGTELATPFGLDREIWQLFLSLPVVDYASSILHRRGRGAAGQDAGHDGAGRRASSALARAAQWRRGRARRQRRGELRAEPPTR